MHSQAYSHAYFTTTCAHTDPDTLVEADAYSKIQKEETSSAAMWDHWLRFQSSESVSKVTWSKRDLLFRISILKTKIFSFLFFFPRRNISKCSTSDSVNTSLWWKIAAKNIPTISKPTDFFFRFEKKTPTYKQHIFNPLIFSAICVNDSQLSQSWKWEAKRKICSGDVH